MSVKRTSSERKGHANTIEKVENCSGSLLRCLSLREVSFQDGSCHYSACFEKGHVPFCFFRKEVPADVAVDQFSYWCRSFKALDDITLAALDRLSSGSSVTHIDDDCQRLCIATVHCRTEQSLKIGLFVKGKYGWIVSTSERLQCYAYTACTIILVLPGGYVIEDICSPDEHISIQKVFPLANKQVHEDKDDRHPVDSASVAATPLGSNPLQLRSNTQLSDALHRQQCNPSKAVAPEREMSPTLPWPNREHKDIQGVNQQGSHLGDKPSRSVESVVKNLTVLVAGSRHGNHSPEVCNDDDFDEEPDNAPNGMPAQCQLHPKECRPGLAKPTIDEKTRVAPLAGQSSEFKTIHPDNNNILYAGERHMPKLVTADSCVVEGIPDPRNDDYAVQQQTCDSKLRSDAQEVLPPVLRYAALPHVSVRAEVSV